MKAFGSTIDCLMKAASLPLRTLSRSGPTVPLAPASASVWHALQPFEAKSVLPSCVALLPPPPAADGVATGLLRLPSQAVNLASGSTTADARIVAWPMPHSSAQTIG